MAYSFYYEPENQEALRMLLQSGEAVGQCDAPGCDHLYELGSRDDHCPECGLCWRHCEQHTPESIQALDEITLMGDDFDD